MGGGDVARVTEREAEMSCGRMDLRFPKDIVRVSLGRDVERWMSMIIVRWLEMWRLMLELLDGESSVWPGKYTDILGEAESVKEIQKIRDLFTVSVVEVEATKS